MDLDKLGQDGSQTGPGAPWNSPKGAARHVCSFISQYRTIVNWITFKYYLYIQKP